MTDVPDASTLPTDLDDAIRTIRELRAAAESRRTIGIAIGILMERYVMNPEAALDYLVGVSSVTGVQVRDVAATVVADALSRQDTG